VYPSPRCFLTSSLCFACTHDSVSLPISSHFITVSFIQAMCLYLPTCTHYMCISCLQTKDIYLIHQGQFLIPDTQILMNNSCAFLFFSFFQMINNKNSIQIPQKYSKKALILSVVAVHNMPEIGIY